MVAMSTPHRLAALALAVLTAGATAACGKGSAPAEEAAPRIPASSDPMTHSAAATSLWRTLS